MRRKFNPKRSTSQYIINENIRGEEFRVIDDQGKQVGVLKRDEALKHAKDLGIDLVLVAPGITPPVVKAIDVHKYHYQEEKRNQEGKKGMKKSQTKDIKLSLFISEHDLERLKNKTSEFLHEGHQVRVKLPLFGRELGKRDMAFDLLKAFIASIEEVQVSSEPRFQGKVLIAVLVRKR